MSEVVSPATSPADRPVLRFGSSGFWVSQAQKDLNRHGCQPLLRIDAQYGALTAAAVRAFQGFHGLDRTGVVDTEVWGALSMEAAIVVVPETVPAVQALMVSGRKELESLLAHWYGAGMNRSQCGVLLYDYMLHSHPWSGSPRRAILALALEILR